MLLKIGTIWYVFRKIIKPLQDFEIVLCQLKKIQILVQTKAIF
jgi:hypothetical protein